MSRFPIQLAVLAPLLLSACAFSLESSWSDPGRRVAPAPSVADDALPSIAEATAGAEPIGGFQPLYWDEPGGRVLLVVSELDTPFLLTGALASGVGSNDIGLDRGQLSRPLVVEWRRIGRRVLLIAPNLDWRSSATDEVERAAVRDAFAESALHGFEALAEDEGRTLVDATDFLVRDIHGIARGLASSGQGAFALDASRSTMLPDSLRGFPDNTEVEALLTFTSDRPGGEVWTVAPDARAVTVRQRVSFVRLPPLDEQRYRPRAWDPRCGFFPTSWDDLTADVDRPTRVDRVTRHRLTADEPIVYHVDRAAPEPVRTALLEGARYWEPVFAAAGWPGGFRVELLPEDADPLDVRYNVIQWVHRSTRGWSYGNALTDPRTGEILKGHVTLGALRVRQDVRLAVGLLSPYGASDDSDPRVLGLALARIRQLAAHEVGHTLGLQHHFGASAVGRASVMDYPPPRVTITEEGELDVADAYRDGAGEWDALAVRYGYGRFENEPAELAEILAAADASGLMLVSDADARARSSAHPRANLWDDRDDAARALKYALDVRSIALERFGDAAIRRGEPLARLEEVLVPLYFHHRYQLEACVRLVGGVVYEHDVRGGSRRPVRPVAADVQEEALSAALHTLDPEFLRLPERIVELLPPPAPGTRAGERFDDRDHLLDPIGIAARGAELTLSLLFDVERMTRVHDQSYEAAAPLGVDRLLELLWRRLEPTVGYDLVTQSILAEERALLLEHMLELARQAPPRVRTVVLGRLELLRAELRQHWPNAPTQDAMETGWWVPDLLDRLETFLDHPGSRDDAPPRPMLPPGPPIGSMGGSIEAGCGFRFDA
jgi:hypothetical protein